MFKFKKASVADAIPVSNNGSTDQGRPVSPIRKFDKPFVYQADKDKVPGSAKASSRTAKSKTSDENQYKSSNLLGMQKSDANSLLSDMSSIDSLRIVNSKNLDSSLLSNEAPCIPKHLTIEHSNYVSNAAGVNMRDNNKDEFAGKITMKDLINSTESSPRLYDKMNTSDIDKSMEKTYFSFLIQRDDMLSKEESHALPLTRKPSLWDSEYFIYKNKSSKTMEDIEEVKKGRNEKRGMLLTFKQ